MAGRLYGIGRVIQITEGYGDKDGHRPVNFKLTMEPNPYTPSLTCEITVAREARGAWAEWADVKVGDRMRIDFQPATEAEWDAFQSAVKTPQAVPA